MFSRAGLCTFTRPFNAKERDTGKLEHRGAFLTEDACADCAGPQAGPSP
ncbi:hypothetical protein ACOZFM_28645 [Streptomyces arboris]